MTRDDSNRTTFERGGETVVGDQLWAADFSDPETFQMEVERGAIEFHGDSLTIDCTENEDGATVWAKREFPADVLVEYTATCREEHDEETSGRNFNCFFAATGEDGRAETLAETERTGNYREYHDLPNYIFTLTYGHMRMRRDPGFEKHSDFAVGAQPDHSYDVQILKRGGEIAASVDGRIVHDWTDADPHGTGWVGLRTWNTRVTYDRWAVYEPR